MRILLDDEIRRLLAAAETHSLVYSVILLTGLRRSELAALQWRDLSLDAKQPGISLRAEVAHNGKPATIPLHVSLLKGLSALAAGPHAPTDPVFGPMPSSREMRSDLSAAGIVLVDRAGRLAEIHSLRHTYHANIHRSAVYPGPYWNANGRPSFRSPRLGPVAQNTPFASLPAATRAREIGPPGAPVGSRPGTSHRRPASTASSRSLTMLLLHVARTSRVTMLVLGILIIGVTLCLGWFLGTAFKPGVGPLTRILVPDSTPDDPSR